MERFSLWLALLAVGCGSGAQEVKHDDGSPSPVDARLDQHRALQKELAASHDRHAALVDAFEKSKEAYLKELQTEVAAAKARPGTAQSIISMAEERIRIAGELRASQRMLDDALLARAAATARMLAVEAKLWRFEEQVFGGRQTAVARAENEVKNLHDVETSLHVAQKAQQTAVGLLSAAEFELNATVGEDREARDIADRRLTGLRAELEEKMTRLIGAARDYETAIEQIHRKLMKQMDGPNAEKVRQLLVEREKAGASVSASRETLKTAMLKRAEDRAREISHDGEIAAVIDGAFRDAKARDELLVKLRGKRDAASEARVAVRKEEEAMAELRRKIVTIEADIQSLGY